MISRSADYFITCYTVLLNKTQQGRNSCPRLQFLAFSLGSIMSLPGPLSFLRSISLISLFSSLSIFGWADLLQILSVIAAFSLAVLFIIVFELSSIFGGLYALSDPICCSFLTWFNYDFSEGQFLSVLSFLVVATTCMIFRIFSIVYCHAFCIWHWPNLQRFGFEFHLSEVITVFI